MSPAKSNVIPLASLGTRTRDRDQQARDVLNRIRLECYEWHAQDLAEAADVSVGTIYAFRSGRTVWPRPRTLFPLLEALGYRIRLEKLK